MCLSVAQQQAIDDAMRTVRLRHRHTLHPSVTMDDARQIVSLSVLTDPVDETYPAAEQRSYRAIRAIGRLLDFNRSTWRRDLHLTHQAEADGLSDTHEVDPAGTPQDALQVAQVLRRIQAMPDPVPTMFALRFEGHCDAEIARQTGFSHPTVTKYLRDAAKRLQRYVGA